MVLGHGCRCSLVEVFKFLRVAIRIRVATAYMRSYVVHSSLLVISTCPSLLIILAIHLAKLDHERVQR